MLWGVYALFLKGDSPSEKAAKDAENARNKEAGFHCLSGWDGSHRAVINAVKGQLKDPDSFEHIKTKITPINEAKEHTLFMEYRANNSFGGKVVGTATAIIKNSDCSATIITYQ